MAQASGDVTQLRHRAPTIAKELFDDGGMIVRGQERGEIEGEPARARDHYAIGPTTHIRRPDRGCLVKCHSHNGPEVKPVRYCKVNPIWLGHPSKAIEL